MNAKKIKQEIIRLSRKHPRYGYRRITALLRREGYKINAKRVARLRREEELKVSKKQRRMKRRDFQLQSSGKQLAAMKYGAGTLWKIRLKKAAVFEY